MPEPLKSEAEASPEGIVFRDDHDFVAVDFIAGTAPKVPSPAWKTTIETMSVAAREAAKAGDHPPARQDPAGPKTG